MSYPSYQPPTSQHQPGPGLPQPAVKKARSFLWIVLITLAGWALFAVPALWLFFSAGFNLSVAPDAPGTVPYVVFSLAAVVCMLFSPVLIGCATTFRRPGLWIAGIITMMPAIVGAAIIYLNPSF